MLDENGPPRKPLTWEEVADCVEMELETRVDAKAAYMEYARATHQGGSGSYTLTCKYCRTHDHHTELCPKKAADLRGESAKCLADAERGGRVCSTLSLELVYLQTMDNFSN